ncbi:unnamed protein product, partial [Discosporangium mesarthrocarpum]
MAQTMEAHRQREFMEKKQNDLMGKLMAAKATAIKQQRTKLYENSSLISECNDLRKEVVYLRRQNDALKQTLKEAHSQASMVAATSTATTAGRTGTGMG